MNTLLKMWTKIDANLSIYTPHLFALSLFLLHLPYFSSEASGLLNSYLLARLVTLSLFGYLIISNSFTQEKHRLTHNKAALLLTLFLLATGLSIIKVFDISAFISNYEDIVLSIFFFINCYLIFQKYVIKTARFAIIAIIISTLISILDELVLLINPLFYMQYAHAFLHESQYEFIQSSLFRGRMYVNRYNEIFIPLFLFLIVLPFKINFKKIMISIMIVLIAVIALFSGWRIRLVASFLGLATLFFFIKHLPAKKQLLIYGISIIATLFLLFVTDMVMRYISGYSTIGRLLFENQEDVEALTSRLYFFEKSVELFSSSPLTGVGLGHYSLIGDKPYRQFYSVFEEREIEAELLSLGPHNIFFHLLAETGIIGFISLVLLLIYFIWQDWHILYEKDKQKKYIYFSLIAGFWILFTFAIFHSEFGFQFYTLLFGFRAVMEALKKVHI